MGKVLQVVACDLPGLEGVKATFNIMVSQTQIDIWAADIKQDGVVLTGVDGWPEQFGTDPFGPDAPLAFRFWCVNRGIRAAIRQFATDPN